MDQTPPPPAGNSYALLIGVNDYSTFDANDANKRHDLKGSCNDVLLLASYCIQVLGIPAANIQVLTSPRLTDDYLQQRSTIPGILGLLPGNMGEATEAEARAGLTRLLQASRKGSALLAFSGHGTWSKAAGPQLCLTDTTPDFTKGVIALADIDREVDGAWAKDRLIAVFDCCHVAAPTARRGGLQAKALQQEGTPDDVTKREDQFDVSNRVILGAKPGKEAYQVLLGGNWHGALTFALTTAAERWRSTNEMSNGAYKHVLRRAKRTLKALGVRQKPALRSPEAQWGGIRRQPFMGVGDGPTVPKPDAEQDGVQLDGGYHYTFQAVDASGAHHDLAVVIAVNTTLTPIKLGANAAFPSSTGSDTGKECWYLNTHNLPNLSSGGYGIVVTKAVLAATELIAVMSSSSPLTGFAGAGGLVNTSSPYLESDETTTTGWVQTTPTFVGTPVFFKSTGGKQVLWMAWDLDAQGALLQVIWYLVTGTPPTTIQPTSYTPFAYQATERPAVGSYYRAASNAV